MWNPKTDTACDVAKTAQMAQMAGLAEIASRAQTARRAKVALPATLSRIAPIALIALAWTFAATGCGDGTGPQAGPGADVEASHPAVAAFRDGFETQAYERLPDLIGSLEAAAAGDPEDLQIGLTLALAHLWGAAEVGRIGGDLASEALHGIAALRELERVRELAPEDARIDGFAGAVRLRIGEKTNDPALVEEGLAEIERGIVRYPEFNLFVRIIVGSRLHRNEPGFARAVAAIWDVFRVCGMDVTPDDPTLDVEVAPQPTGPDRVCWNSARSLHNFEGTWVYVGDALAKSGDPATARALYRNAMLFDSYESWPFRSLLERRIEEADEMAARFTDDDPANDPQIVGDSPVQCTVCHAR